MTDQGTQVATRAPGWIAATRDFLLDTRGEMEKVNWPPREELVKATKAVLIGATTFGIVIGLVDWLLTKILVDGVALLSR